MGFTAGMVSSMGLGVPHYYIDSGGNQWDAHTWVNFHFDSSGSMNDIINPLINAMTGAYFSSGSAAGQDGVKSTTSLRAELQDLYATGGIEGAPDWNTDDTTNGKDAYDAHVNHRQKSDERWLSWSGSHYVGGSPQSWNNLGNNNTVNNIIQVFVINESKGGYPGNTRGGGYYSTPWGEPFTGTLTKTVQATTSNSTAVVLDSITGLVKTTDNVDSNNVSEPFAQHMKLTAVSAGSLSGTPTISNISSNTVTLSSAQSFSAGTQLTFSMTSFGFNSTNGSFHYSSPDDHNTYATDIVGARNTLGLGSGMKDILTNSGQKPSITYIIIDAGSGTNTRVSAINNVGNGVVGNAHNGPGGLNASQRHVQEGVIEGKLTFHATRTDGNNRSLNDFADITSWNDKSNMLHLVALTNQSANTSQAYWKDQLRAALQLNVSF